MTPAQRVTKSKKALSQKKTKVRRHGSKCEIDTIKVGLDNNLQSNLPNLILPNLITSLKLIKAVGPVLGPIA